MALRASAIASQSPAPSRFAALRLLICLYGLLVSYSTLVSLAYNLLIRNSTVGILEETCGFEVVAPVWSSGL